jgi:hypothetical protein
MVGAAVAVEAIDGGSVVLNRSVTGVLGAMLVAMLR